MADGKVSGARARMCVAGPMGGTKGGKDVSPTAGIAGGGKEIGRTVTSMGKIPCPQGTLHFDGKAG